MSLIDELGLSGVNPQKPVAAPAAPKTQTPAPAPFSAFDAELEAYQAGTQGNAQAQSDSLLGELGLLPGSPMQQQAPVAPPVDSVLADNEQPLPERSTATALADTFLAAPAVGAVQLGTATTGLLGLVPGVNEATRYVTGKLDSALGGTGEGWTLTEGLDRVNQSTRQALYSDPLLERQRIQARKMDAIEADPNLGTIDKIVKGAGTLLDDPTGAGATTVVESLANMVPGLGVTAKAGNAARAAALARSGVPDAAGLIAKASSGAALTAAEKAAVNAANAAALQAGVRANVAYSGGLGAAYGSQEAAERIYAIPPEQLAQEPDMQALMNEGYSFNEARDTLIRQAQWVAAPVAGGLSAVAGRVAAPFEAKAVTGLLPSGIAGRAGSALLGGAREATEEGFQEPSEGFGAALGIKTSGANPNQDLTEGLATRAGMSMALGGLTGAGIGAISPTRATNETAPDPIDPAVLAQQQQQAEAANQAREAAAKARQDQDDINAKAPTNPQAHAVALKGAVKPGMTVFVSGQAGNETYTVVGPEQNPAAGQKPGIVIRAADGTESVVPVDMTDQLRRIDPATYRKSLFDKIRQDPNAPHARAKIVGTKAAPGDEVVLAHEEIPADNNGERKPYTVVERLFETVRGQDGMAELDKNGQPKQRMVGVKLRDSANNERNLSLEDMAWLAKVEPVAAAAPDANAAGIALQQRQVAARKLAQDQNKPHAYTYNPPSNMTTLTGKQILVSDRDEGTLTVTGVQTAPRLDKKGNVVMSGTQVVEDVTALDAVDDATGQPVTIPAADLPLVRLFDARGYAGSQMPVEPSDATDVLPKGGKPWQRITNNLENHPKLKDGSHKIKHRADGFVLTPVQQTTPAAPTGPNPAQVQAADAKLRARQRDMQMNQQRAVADSPHSYAARTATPVDALDQLKDKPVVIAGVDGEYTLTNVNFNSAQDVASGASFVRSVTLTDGSGNSIDVDGENMANIHAVNFTKRDADRKKAQDAAAKAASAAQTTANKQAQAAAAAQAKTQADAAKAAAQAQADAEKQQKIQRRIAADQLASNQAKNPWHAASRSMANHESLKEGDVIVVADQESGPLRIESVRADYTRKQDSKGRPVPVPDGFTVQPLNAIGEPDGDTRMIEGDDLNWLKSVDKTAIALQQMRAREQAMDIEKASDTDVHPGVGEYWRSLAKAEKDRRVAGDNPTHRVKRVADTVNDKGEQKWAAVLAPLAVAQAETEAADTVADATGNADATEQQASPTDTVATAEQETTQADQSAPVDQAQTPTDTVPTAESTQQESRNAEVQEQAEAQSETATDVASTPPTPKHPRKPKQAATQTTATETEAPPATGATDATAANQEAPAPKKPKRSLTLKWLGDSIEAELAKKEAELAERLKSQMGTVSSGVDYKLLELGAEIGALYVAKGAVKFADFAYVTMHRMTTYGVQPSQLKSHIKDFYVWAMMRVNSNTRKQMDSVDTVADTDIDAMTAEIEQEIASDDAGQTDAVPEPAPAEQANAGVATEPAPTKPVPKPKRETESSVTDSRQALRDKAKELGRQWFSAGKALIDNDPAFDAMQVGTVIQGERTAQTRAYIAGFNEARAESEAKKEPSPTATQAETPTTTETETAATSPANNDAIPDINKMTQQERIAYAKDLGGKAYKAGIERAAGADYALQAFLLNIKDGSRTSVLKAWLAGWDAANLAAPTQSQQQVTTNEPQTILVAKAFRDRLLSGQGFSSITEARKFAESVTGVAVKAGTMEAKQLDEAIEVGVVMAAREIASGKGTPIEKYQRLVELYKNQPTLAVRTSTSVMNQAYSTPAPLAFIASQLAGVANAESVYEPSAGNGMLLIEADTAAVTANELDPARAAALREIMPGATVTEGDATKNQPNGTFASIIANPPFGIVKDDNGKTVIFDAPASAAPDGVYSTREIDHAIALKALDAMSDNGRAVLILGGVDAPTTDARSDKYNAGGKRTFFYSLYQQYNVVEHFTVDGDLYNKQGAGWPVDVIVIDGRGKSSLPLPAVKPTPRIYFSWNELQEVLENANNRRVVADQSAGGRGTGRGGETNQPADAPQAADRATGETGNAAGGVDATSEAVSGQPRDTDQRGTERSGNSGGRSGRRSAKSGAGNTESPVADTNTAQSAGAEAASAGENTQTGGADGKMAGGSNSAAAQSGVNDDLDAMFDEVLAEELGKSQQASTVNTQAPTPNDNTASNTSKEPETNTATPQSPSQAGKSTRSAGQAAVSAAKEAAAGIEDMFNAMNALFGNKGGTLNSGLSFNEETYAAAKPLFIQALGHFKNAASDVREAMRLVINGALERFGPEMVGNMKPYIVRFIADVRDGKIDISQPDEQHDEQVDKAPEKPVERKTEVASEGQSSYVPTSKAGNIGTLVPTNMRDAVKSALDNLTDRVGDIDTYVARELGYSNSDVGKYFSAEQIDALALAIDSMASGKGWIIGDQTGVGKGRVNAAIIRWALRNGRTPVFVTEKPNLYRDMLRDLADIGQGRDMREVAQRVLMTNADADIPIDDEAMAWFEESERAEADGLPKPPKPKDGFLPKAGAAKQKERLAQMAREGRLSNEFDVVFTTYSQMQTVAGDRTVRHSFLDAIAQGGVLILDEAHNAGGQGKDEDPNKLTRSDFVRQLARKAFSVFYSSATYAKRPDVMDLYFRTDLSLAVPDIKRLGETIAQGGVPLQQVVASMLTESGQYMRRERSFDGVEYNTPRVNVDKQAADSVATVMQAIMQFSNLASKTTNKISEEMKREARSASSDNSTGGAGAESTNFTAVMHNLIAQYLLSAKVDSAVDSALAALSRGEKPVITVANTMESLINEYADDNGVGIGDPINMTFRVLFRRYLEKSRIIRERKPFQKGGGTVRVLTDDELGPEGVAAYDAAMAAIDAANVDQLSVSPIDAIKGRLARAGYRVGEITGRQGIIDYTRLSTSLAAQEETKLPFKVPSDPYQKRALGEYAAADILRKPKDFVGQWFNVGDVVRVSRSLAPGAEKTPAVVVGAVKRWESGENTMTELAVYQDGMVFLVGLFHGSIERAGNNEKLNNTNPNHPNYVPGDIGKYQSQLDSYVPPIPARKGGIPLYAMRGDRERSIAGRLKTIEQFNNGELDVIVLNRAGSTGLSLHASPKTGRDLSRRHMIIAQAEANIDTHMQMLGRVHRTGQVIPPRYSQLVADVPAEMRPAAVLAKKMASLNANTSAARTSAVTAKDVPDFINEYGDEVVADLMFAFQDLHQKLGSPLSLNKAGDGFYSDDAARRITGRIPLLSLQDQEDFYANIESSYADLLAMKEAMGENKLEARTLPLDAKPVKRITLTEGVDEKSPFARGSTATIYNVKRLGKAMTEAEIQEAVDAFYDGRDPNDFMRSMQAKLNRDFDGYLKEELRGVDDDRKAAVIQDRLEHQRNRLEEAMTNYAPGQSITMVSSAGLVTYGRVLRLERKGKTKNPAANGAWRITLALADSSRQISLPLSKVLFGESAADELIPDGKVVLRHESDEAVADALKRSESMSREHRVILEGNLLSAYNALPGGQIIYFEGNDGSVRQGVLMPKSFNLKTAMEKRATAIDTPAAAFDILKNDRRAILTNTDDTVRVGWSNGWLTIQVPSSKSKGGRYFLNKNLLDNAMGGNFIKKGSLMQARISDDDALGALQALYELGDRLRKPLTDDEKGDDSLDVRSYEKQPEVDINKAAFVVQSGGLRYLPGADWLTGDWTRGEPWYVHLDTKDKLWRVGHGGVGMRFSGQKTKQEAINIAKDAIETRWPDIKRQIDASGKITDDQKREAIKNASARRSDAQSIPQPDSTNAGLQRPANAVRPSGETVESIKAHLVKKLGRRYERLFGPNSRVTILQSPAEMGEPWSVRGLYINGQAYLFADNLSTDSATWSEWDDGYGDPLGVLLHEGGVHHGRTLRGDRVFQQYLKAMDRLRYRDERVNQAFDRAMGAGAPAQYLTEEAMGHLIESHPDMPLARKFVAWLRSKLRTIMPWLNLSRDEIVQFARGVLRDEARLAEGSAAVGPMNGMRSGAGKQSLPDMIDVDGVQRPTTNSEGRPIHPTAEGVRNFWRWFGESKIVDKQGRPLTAYHGTPDGGFSEFTQSSKGKRTNHNPDDVGYHFTSDPSYAEAYNEGYKLEIIEKYRSIFGSEPTGTKMPAGSLIYPVYLRLQNPMMIGASKNINKELIHKAVANGHDGIIADMGGAFEYVAFRPDQIKSATGNRGEFNSATADILYSAPRPAPSQSAGTRATIDADPDFDAIITEAERNIQAAMAQIQQVKPKRQKLLDAVKSAVGMNAGARSLLYNFATRQQVVEMAEKAMPQAQRYERFAREMTALATEKEAVAGELGERWRGMIAKDQVNATRMTRIMMAATRAEVSMIDGAPADPDKQDIYNTLRDAFNKLPPEWQAMYKEIRDAYSDQRDAYMDALEKRIQDSEMDGRTKRQMIDGLRKTFESNKVEGDYFPLTRFGDLWIRATKEGQEEQFMLFESMSDWQDMQSALRAAGWTVASGKEMKNLHLNAPPSTAFVSQMFDMVDKSMNGEAARVMKDDIYQMYLRTLPEMSIRHKFQHRKGRAGFSMDALRAFSQQMAHGSRQIARLTYAHKLSGVLEEMRDITRLELIDRDNGLFIKGPQDRVMRWLEDAGIDATAVTEGVMVEDDDAIADARALLEKKIPADRVKAADVVTALDKNFNWMMNPSGSNVAGALTGIGFLWHLAISPAAAMINMTQQAIITFPTMAARYGVGTAWKLMHGNTDYFSAYGVGSKRLAGSPTAFAKLYTEGDAVLPNWDRAKAQAVIEQARRDYLADKIKYREYHKLLKDNAGGMGQMLLDLQDAGTLDRTLTHSLMGMSEMDMAGKVLGVSAIDYQRWMKGASYLFHGAERANRYATAIAGYRLARAGSDKVAALGHTAAIDYTRQLVDRTHYEYSSGNRAPFMQSDTAKVLLLFRQYSQNTTYMLMRGMYQSFSNTATAEEKAEARKRMIGVLGMTALFAGTMGLPLFSTIMWVAEAIANAGDDDDPVDVKLEFRNWLAKAGPFGDLVARGAFNTLTGLDVSTRTKLDELWFRSPSEDLDGKQLAMYWLEQAAGPVVGGLGVSAFRAMDQVGDALTKGDVWGMWRGAETLLPKGVRDVMKSYRYSDAGEGGVLGYDKEVIAKTPNPWGLVWQAMGMTPADVAERHEQNASLKRMDRAIADRRKILLNAYYLSVYYKDPEMQQRVLKKVEAFNKAQPAYPITGDSLRRSLRAKYQAQLESVDGLRLTEKLRPQIEEMRYYE